MLRILSGLANPWVILAGLLRLVLFLWGFYDVFGIRKEIVTPITDYKRVTEGLFLLKLNNNPYTGDAFHQPPLVLNLFHPFQNNLFAAQMFYIFMDILFALILRDITFHWQRISNSKKAKKQDNNTNDVLSMTNLPEIAAYLYLYNPFAIVSCLGMSTIILNNVSIAFSVYFALIGNSAFSLFSLAVASYLTFYPMMLIFPLSLLISKKNIFVNISVFSLFVGGLLYLSFLLGNSWEFLIESYGFTLLVSDLTPNIGLFWYFFTEVFKHYQNFYLFVYQYQMFIYAIPLYLRVRNHPMVIFWMMLGMMAAFKSYPGVGDIALQVSFIPLVFDKIKGNRYGFIVAIVAIFISVLAPIFWLMWIYQGTGNANFYYAINLVSTVAQVMLIMDSLTAVLREEYQAKKANTNINNNNIQENKKDK